MRRFFRILSRIALWFLIILVVILTGVSGYALFLYNQADMKQPAIEVDMSEYHLDTDTDSLRVCGDNSLFLNRMGLWEACLSGSPIERGASFGAMAKDLLYYQEKTFVDQIKVLVPSERYLRFLRAFLEIFNRDMSSFVPDEFREEIYSISLSCTHEFDVFGTPYERQMHYHAAHDIGHMMQEYMLVGCSSFAAWGDGQTDDGELLVGRNFDFWVGDDFAKNKIVLFVSPERGYRYASVSWPGMTGVVSGMNEKGLTITMNASKGAIPTSSAMPVSLLARQILMYASNISEAYQIARQNTLFVSESLLVASAEDGRAAVIEKTPDKTALYDPQASPLICTNHFQSDVFSADSHNIRNINETDSRYRYDRLGELIHQRTPLDPQDAADILRDRFGNGGRDVGLANEMTLNQSIAHHAVIFRPGQMQMWVSTFPWQSGTFVCYDLKKIFSSDMTADGSLMSEDMNIAADHAYLSDIYPRVLMHRKDAADIRKSSSEGTEVAQEILDRFEKNNPEFYETYIILAEYYESRGDQDRALGFWKKSLTKEFPYKSGREEVERIISERHDKK